MLRREAKSASVLEAVAAIAEEAGARIREVYNSDFAVSQKGDSSPLTQADLVAHGVIVAALQRLRPEVPVLSEEAAEQQPYSARKLWQRYWLVDPLDGTKEFVSRNGEFTVNVALIEDGAPVLGVVHAPILNTTYAALRGESPWKRTGREVSMLRTRPVPERPTFVVSRSHQDETLKRMLAGAPPHDAINRGSSLKFCLVAEGSADFYPRTGPTSEWDTAAGQCLVECAGGAVLRLPETTPLRYNEKESLLNPNFAVIGDPSHDWSMLLRECCG